MVKYLGEVLLPVEASKGLVGCLRIENRVALLLRLQQSASEEEGEGEEGGEGGGGGGGVSKQVTIRRKARTSWQGEESGRSFCPFSPFPVRSPAPPAPPATGSWSLSHPNPKSHNRGAAAAVEGGVEEGGGEGFTPR